MVVRADQKGYVAILAVLIIGAASLAISLALLTAGADSQRGTLITQQSAQARSLATSCVEEALQQMHDNTAFTGTNSLSLGQGSCSYTVTNTGSTGRTVDASGTVSNVVRKAKVYVTITSSSISITSWQEVGDA
jgi:hypothetical protein